MASWQDPVEVLGASPGREHYTRLTRLLISGGTSVLRELFDSIHPPANLSAVLKSPTVSSTLNRMRKKRFLTHPQWKTLFPTPGTCGQSKSFDITLLCKLFREVCSLTAPATGWDSLPNNTDLSLTADLARIKYFRNSIYGHVNEKMDLRDDEFVRLWEEIKDALLRIVKHYAPSGSTLLTDWKNAIDNLLIAPLTHEDEIHLEELKQWYLEDMEVKKTLEEMRKTAEGTRQAVEEMRDHLRTSTIPASTVTSQQTASTTEQWNAGMSPHPYELILLPSKAKKCYGCRREFAKRYRSPPHNLVVKHVDRRVIRENEQTGQLIYSNDYENTYYHLDPKHIREKNPNFTSHVQITSDLHISLDSKIKDKIKSLGFLLDIGESKDANPLG